jgi:hypothetical protein
LVVRAEVSYETGFSLPVHHTGTCEGARQSARATEGAGDRVSASVQPGRPARRGSCTLLPAERPCNRGSGRPAHRVVRRHRQHTTGTTCRAVAVCKRRWCARFSARRKKTQQISSCTSYTGAWLTCAHNPSVVFTSLHGVCNSPPTSRKAAFAFERAPRPNDGLACRHGRTFFRAHKSPAPHKEQHPGDGEQLLASMCEPQR